MFQNFPLMTWRLGAILIVIATIAIARGMYLHRPSEGDTFSVVTQVIKILALLSGVAYLIFHNRERLAF